MIDSRKRSDLLMDAGAEIFTIRKTLGAPEATRYAEGLLKRAAARAESLMTELFVDTETDLRTSDEIEATVFRLSLMLFLGRGSSMDEAVNAGVFFFRDAVLKSRVTAEVVMPAF